VALRGTNPTHMKPVTVKTQVRPQFRDELNRIASRDDLSLSDLLRRYIREGLARDKEQEQAQQEAAA